MCGESSEDNSHPSNTLGSPPHVWGKLFLQRIYLTGYRITPTCVGKADLLLCLDSRLQDHPHMCGESYYYRCHG